VAVFLLDPVVTLGLEPEGEILVAAQDDAALGHDMNLVGNDVVEQALVVGDHEHADVRTAQGVHAGGDDLERIDVETTVGLVEHRIGGLKHGHLQNLTALLLAAREPLVHGTGGEIARHTEGVHLGVELRVILGRLEFLPLGKTRLQGGADEVGDGHAGDLHGVLEGKEESEPGTDIGFEPENALAVEKDITGGHGVVGVTGHDFCECALACPVLAHDGVDLSLGNIEGEPLKDRLVTDGGVQIFDGKGVSGHWRLLGGWFVFGMIGGLCSRAAVGAETAEGHVVLGDEETERELPPLVTGFGKFDIGDMAALRAVEVSVLAEIRAEAGGFPINMDGFDQPIANHRLEAIIDRSQGDRGHPLLGPDEDFRGSRMVPLGHQHLIDMAPLRREAQPLAAHRPLVGGNGIWRGFLHDAGKKTTIPKSSIKNYSK
jgi:hypothetical protein